MPAPRIPTMAYVIWRGPDHIEAEEPLYRTTTRARAERLADMLAADESGVFRVRHYRRPGTLYSAGRPE